MSNEDGSRLVSTRVQTRQFQLLFHSRKIRENPALPNKSNGLNKANRTALEHQNGATRSPVSACWMRSLFLVHSRFGLSLSLFLLSDATDCFIPVCSCLLNPPPPPNQPTYPALNFSCKCPRIAIGAFTVHSLKFRVIISFCWISTCWAYSVMRIAS